MFSPEELDQVGPGWRTILLELGDELLRFRARFPNHPLSIGQVKEKFGGLRVYLDYVNFEEEQMDELEELVRTAESKSFNCCELCGATPVERRRPKGKKFGWLKTLCLPHQAERDQRG